MALHDIKRRIKSIGNTRKITRAMQMVAAAKMRKATEAALQTRAYSNLSWETVLNLSRALNNASGGELHPLLTRRETAKRVAIILISSNRGLCGGFNSAIISKVHSSIRKHARNTDGSPREHDIFLIGKKGAAIYKYYGYNIVAEFPKSDVTDEVAEIIPAAKMVVKGFLEKKYDKVLVAYTDFINVAKQEPRVKQLLPVDLGALEDHFGSLGCAGSVSAARRLTEEKAVSRDDFSFEYLFEPSPREVLNELVPRLLEAQIFQALLESNASVHSARMAAMKQATDAAGDLVDELTLAYNKERQSQITSELAEISAGANAIGK